MEEKDEIRFSVIITAYNIKDYIEISKWLKEECDKYNLPFIDISHNREKVIDEFVKNIIEKS